MSIKVAINGFGRIGRVVFRIAQETGRLKENVEIVAINARADSSTLAHLFKHDSIYGKFSGTVETTENTMIVNGKEIKLFRESDPVNCPWGELGVDIVIDSTGVFKDKKGLSKHITAGAKK